MSILFKIYITVSVAVWLTTIVYACIIGDFDTAEDTKFYNILVDILIVLLILGFIYAISILMITLWKT